MKNYKYIFWSFLLLIVSILILLFFQFTVDDAYITYRHSFNFFQNGNLSWNNLGNREEAFSNPLFVILGGIGIKLGLKPELPIKILNLSILAFWFLRIKEIVKRMLFQQRAVIYTLFFCSFPVFIHAFAGLETFLFSFLLFEYLNSIYIGNQKSIIISSILLITRPEGLLFFITSIIALLCSNLQNINNIKHLKVNLKFLTTIIIASLSLIILIYKIQYFGDFFPNTYYAKSTSKTVITILRNCRSNLSSSLPWIFMVFLCLDFNQIISKNKFNILFKYGPFIAIYILYLQSALAMNYADRFWFQLFWPLIIYFITNNKNILIINLSNIKNLVLNSKKIKKFAFVLISSLWSIKSVSLGYVKDPDDTPIRLVSSFGRIVRSRAVLGKELDRILPKKTKIVIGDAGLLGFYANREAYDYLKLGTKEIAKKGLTQEFLNKVNPDLFILYGFNRDNKSGCDEKDTRYLMHKEEIRFIRKNDFKFIGGFVQHPTKCQNIFAKKDLANYFNDKTFISLMKSSEKNHRSILKGTIDDILYSYKYIFLPSRDLPKS